MIQAWGGGDCEVREFLDLTKSRRSSRAVGGVDPHQVVRTSLHVGKSVGVVGTELYL